MMPASNQVPLRAREQQDEDGFGRCADARCDGVADGLPGCARAMPSPPAAKAAKEEGNLVGAIELSSPKKTTSAPSSATKRATGTTATHKGMLRSAVMGLRFQFLAFSEPVGDKALLSTQAFRFKFDHDGFVAD